MTEFTDVKSTELGRLLSRTEFDVRYTCRWKKNNPLVVRAGETPLHDDNQTFSLEECWNTASARNVRTYIRAVKSNARRSQYNSVREKRVYEKKKNVLTSGHGQWTSVTRIWHNAEFVFPFRCVILLCFTDARVFLFCLHGWAGGATRT